MREVELGPDRLDLALVIVNDQLGRFAMPPGETEQTIYLTLAYSKNLHLMREESRHLFKHEFEWIGWARITVAGDGNVAHGIGARLTHLLLARVISMDDDTEPFLSNSATKVDYAFAGPTDRLTFRRRW